MLHKHSFIFNPQDNGGESLILSTEFFDNGDGEIYTNQELKLHSYCNLAVFKLVGCPITPEVLRKLANEMEHAKSVAMQSLIV